MKPPRPIAARTASRRKPCRYYSYKWAEVLSADSFAAFNRRISAFLDHYPQLEDGSLLFGHGIWIGLLAWRLLGFRAETSADMSAFRRFQSALPMPNTAVWQLQGDRADTLRLRCHQPAMP